MTETAVPTAAEVRTLIAATQWPAIVSRLEGVEPAHVVEPAVAAAGYKAFVALKDDAAAERWLDRSLHLAPGNATFWRNKGVMHQKRSEWSDALACFTRAAELRPDVATYQGSMALALYQSGRHAQAAAAFQRALALDDTQRAWWIRLARSFFLCGDLQEAAAAYRRALALQADAATQSAHDEILRQIRSGSRAASASYYDAVFAESTKYAQPAHACDYAPVWARIVEVLRDLGARSLLDLGCGPGQFAEFVARALPHLAYCGIDFSGVAVARGRQRVPHQRFLQRELPLRDFTDLPEFDAVVCTEVLEHVESDREILAVLPRGTPVIATVPSFDAFGHLRLFRTEAEIRSRYGELLEDLSIAGHAIGAQNTLWLIQGRRSAAALLADAAQEGQRFDPPAHVVDSIFLADGTRYVEDFLPMFGLPFVPVIESIGRTDAHVALRHDVDWSIENALAMATLEHQQGIRSSYYLLHPDGDVQRQNYFGQVVADRLLIHPSLFDHARRLVDLGHEVGLHNDLISLSLSTGRAPGEFLEQILEAFLRAGIPLRGSVAHGSSRCRSLGYMNFQIFADFTPADIAVDYQDRPELFDCFADDTAVQGGSTVRKFALRMADFGLRYEANFTPRDLYLSDSSARWTFWHDAHAQRFDKHTPRPLWSSALREALDALPGPQRVQCLVHACHWGVLSQFNPGALNAVRGRRDRAFATLQRDTLTKRLASHPNVRVAKPSARFDAYDQQYARNAQLYTLAPSVRRFTQALVAPGGPAHGARRVLELGCGQGDYLAFAVDALDRANPGRQVSGLGVDGSGAAILACAGRYPTLAWACDSLEDFIAGDDALPATRGQPPLLHDLVLDKTGTIFIATPRAAGAFLAALSARMAPGALYVYVASRHYYQEVLRRKQHADWPQDWLELAAETFEPVLEDDDDAPELKGYLKRVFRRR